MKKVNLIYQRLSLLVILFGIIPLNAQIDSTLIKKKQQVYTYNKKLDTPLIAATAGISIYNFSQIFNKKSSSDESILALDVNDVNKFDRGAAGNYDLNAKTASDFFLLSTSPLPFIFFALDKEMRQDYLRLSLLYIEAMSFTGLAYSTSNQFNDRLRPLSYNQDVDILERTKGRNKNSFYSGHTVFVATSTFFLAKVYDDYHPNSPYKWVFYGGASLATFLTGHLRVKAGYHFPTDVLVGGLMGAALGFLVPFFHKNKLLKDEKLTLMPVTGEYHGLHLAYTF